MKKISYLLTIALLASCSTEVDLQQVETENAEGSLPQVTVINQVGEVTPLLASAVAQGQWKATNGPDGYYVDDNIATGGYNYQLDRKDLIGIYH